MKLEFLCVEISYIAYIAGYNYKQSENLTKSLHTLPAGRRNRRERAD